MTFEGKILAFVLYSVMSKNLGNSIDVYNTNKYQRLRFWRGLDLSLWMGFPRTFGHR